MKTERETLVKTLAKRLKGLLGRQALQVLSSAIQKVENLAVAEVVDQLSKLEEENPSGPVILIEQGDKLEPRSPGLPLQGKRWNWVRVLSLAGPYVSLLGESLTPHGPRIARVQTKIANLHQWGRVITKGGFDAGPTPLTE